MTSTAVLVAALAAVSVALLILMVATVRQAITISDLRAKVATRDGIIDEKTQAAYDLEAVAVNLRKQCDGLIVENARLRQANTEKTDYVAHLALDLAEANDRRLSRAPWPKGPVQFWMCSDPEHTMVEWRGDVAHCMTPECGRTSADAVDADVTRPYVPECEAWKDELR